MLLRSVPRQEPTLLSLMAAVLSSCALCIVCLPARNATKNPMRAHGNARASFVRSILTVRELRWGFK